jgi:hypothetical protein
MSSLIVASDFSRTPGSRYVREGEFSGELFRTSLLAPRVRQAIAAGTTLQIDLDGTAGYGTSFLEEAFGGLVRNDGVPESELRSTLRFVTNEEPYLEDDIWDYIAEAERARSKGSK